MKTYDLKNICTWMFIGALFIAGEVLEKNQNVHQLMNW